MQKYLCESIFIKPQEKLHFKGLISKLVNIASGEPFWENGIVKITNSQYTPKQASHSQFTGSEPQTPMFSCGKILTEISVLQNTILRKKKKSNYHLPIFSTKSMGIIFLQAHQVAVHFKITAFQQS